MDLWIISFGFECIMTWGWWTDDRWNFGLLVLDLNAIWVKDDELMIDGLLLDF